MKSLKNKLYSKEGITLVALIITILLLLILSAITINQLTGDNGLFSKAKEAKEKTINKQKEENTTLEDFEKNIDYYVGASRNTNTSEIIKDATISLEEKDGIITVTILPVLSQEKTQEDIYLAILIMNDKCIKYSTSNIIEVNYGEYSASTEYKISVLLIDKSGKVFSTKDITYKTAENTYEKRLLEFPIITANGVCNTGIYCIQTGSLEKYEYDYSYGNTSNALSIKIEGYDGDFNTSAVILNSIDTGYIDVDSSCVGKKIIINGARNCHINKNTSSGVNLGSTSNTSDEGVRIVIDVTNDIKRIYFTTQSKALGNLYFKEITVED